MCIYNICEPITTRKMFLYMLWLILNLWFGIVAVILFSYKLVITSYVIGAFNMIVVN